MYTPTPLRAFVACVAWLLLALCACTARESPENRPPEHAVALLMYRAVALDSTWLDAERPGLLRVAPPLAKDERLQARLRDAKGAVSPIVSTLEATDSVRTLVRLEPDTWPTTALGQKQRLEVSISGKGRMSVWSKVATVRWQPPPSELIAKAALEPEQAGAMQPEAALWNSVEAAEQADERDPADGIRAFREAASLAQKLGVAGAAADALRRACHAARLRGDYALALLLIEQAAQENARVKDPLGEANQAYHEALLASMLGRLVYARARAEVAQAAARASERTTLVCMAEGLLGDIFQAENRYIPAFAAYERARQCLDRLPGDYPAAVAVLETNHAWALLRAAADGLRPQYAQADQLLIDAAASATSPSTKASALANLAWSLWQQKRFEEALTTLRRAVEADPTGASDVGAFVPLLEGWAQFSQGHTLEARAAFQKVLRGTEQSSGFTALLAAQAHFAWAETWGEQAKKNASALEHHQRAVDLALRAGAYGTMADPEAFLFAHPAQLADALLASLAARGLASRVLDVVSQLQFQAHRSWRRAARDVGVEREAAKLMAAVRSRHATAQRAVQALEGERWQVTAADARDFEARLQKARAEQQDALEQILSLANADDSVSPEPSTGPDSVRFRLQADEALLVVREVQGAWLSLLSLPDQEPKVAVVSQVGGALSVWDGVLSGVHHLFVVNGGDARVHELPFLPILSGAAEARNDGTEASSQAVWLTRFSFSLLPHAGVLAGQKRWLGRAATTIFANPDGTLPHARHEGSSILALRPWAKLWVASETSVEKFIGAVSAPGVVHFAGHVTQLEGDPWSTRMHFPRETHLLFSDLGLTRAAADLVVLSGCESARTVRIRPEQRFGLSEVLLSAGAQRVVATRHALHDRKAAELMEAFYASLDQHGPAEALRRAALDAKARGNPNWNSLLLFGGR